MSLIHRDEGAKLARCNARHMQIFITREPDGDLLIRYDDEAWNDMETMLREAMEAIRFALVTSPPNAAAAAPREWADEARATCPDEPGVRVR